MRYQVGEQGRVVVARFNDGDAVLEGLNDIVRNENIGAAVVYLVGGMKKGGFVVGPETDDMPPVPIWREMDESHEIVGIGTIFWQGDEPRIHFHGTYAKRDRVLAGCLRRQAETFLVLEAVIMEIKGINAVRAFDPSVGLALLKL